MKYSLADYILTIRPDDSRLRRFYTATVGGEGNALDSIEINYANNMWETTSYATGSWVHNKNLARNGVVQISLSQLTDNVTKFMYLANAFFSQDYQGLTLSLVDSTGQEIALCEDCYFTKIPTQAYGPSAANQTWQLTCGKITFE